MTDKVYVKGKFKGKYEDKFKSSYVIKYNCTYSIEEKVDIELKRYLDKYRLDELVSNEKLIITIQSEEDYISWLYS